MPDLGITVEKVEVVPFAASPTLAFTLRVANADPAETIQTVVLRCQIQIEVTRRRYTALDQERLRDLFGEPERWSQTLRNLLWTNATTVIPQFTGTTTADLHVPCTFDFSIATTKYFNGLADGDIPVLLMFSGTVFYADPAGALRAAPISWDKETRFRLPLKVWKDMMRPRIIPTAHGYVFAGIFLRSCIDSKQSAVFPLGSRRLRRCLPLSRKRRCRHERKRR